MEFNTLIEIAATLLSLLYVIFLIREKIICWPFGIAGSLLSIYLFINAQLYSESILYSYYVIVGIWGWIHWSKLKDYNPISKATFPQHIKIIVISSGLATLLGYGFTTYTNAERAYIDAFTTIFSFAATYMEVKKILETWVYWFVINLVSIWLYQDRNLDIYAALIAVYSVLSVWGFIQWRKSYDLQSHPSVNSFAFF